MYGARRARLRRPGARRWKRLWAWRRLETAVPSRRPSQFYHQRQHGAEDAEQHIFQAVRALAKPRDRGVEHADGREAENTEDADEHKRRVVFVEPKEAAALEARIDEAKTPRQESGPGRERRRRNVDEKGSRAVQHGGPHSVAAAA